MASPVKIAMIGCGGIANQHTRGYAELYKGGCRDFEYVACCDINEAGAKARAAQIAEIQGAEPKVFTDVGALLQSGIAEAADICLPHWLHHIIGIQCLEGGLHVMIEKPIGLTIKATKAIIAAGKKAGKVVATAENIRRYQTARAFHWALNEKKMIGDLLTVKSHQIMNKPPDYTPYAWKWRGVKLLTGGGMIMDSGAHYADMNVLMFGEPDKIACSMWTYCDLMVEDAPVVGTVKSDVEDAWHAIIRFKSGLEVTWTYSRVFHGDSKCAYYYGTEGTITDNKVVFHPFQNGGLIHLPNGTEIGTEAVVADYMKTLSEDRKRMLFPYGCVNGFGVQTWDFADSIRNNRKPEMDGEDGLKSKALCEACFEAATCGEYVSYDDVLSGKVNAYQKPIDEYWKL